MGNLIISKNVCNSLLLLIIITGFVCIGCSNEHYANEVINQNTFLSQAAIATHNTKSMKMLGVINDTYSIKAPDGAKMDVWVMLNKNRDHTPTVGTIVLLHGLYDSKARMLGLGENFAKHGYDVVLMDLRKHGGSGGKYVTFGAKEKYDVKAVVNYLLKKEKVQQPIYAVGFSMGAATSILYAAIDDRCKGVFAIAPYKNAESATHKLLPLMSKEKYHDIWQLAGEIGNFDPNDGDVARAAQKINGPLLIAHGTLDSICPYDDSKVIIKAAREPKKLETIPLANHATILLKGDDWFVKQFESFVVNRKKEAIEKPEEYWN